MEIRKEMSCFFIVIHIFFTKKGRLCTTYVLTLYRSIGFIFVFEGGDMERFTISQVAKACGVHIETVRYYERRELIAKPSRNESGYRMFTGEAVQDIRFIKKAQEIGFTLEEIRKLLNIYKKEDYFPINEMHQFAVSKIKEIDEKIRDLQQFKTLLTIATSVSPSSKLTCPVIQKCVEENVRMGAKIEVFVDNSPLSTNVIQKVKELACSKCEVIVYESDYEDKMKAYGIECIPAVVMNGKVVDVEKIKK
jgi:DNA-binding transcriptional MerR regulator